MIKFLRLLKKSTAIFHAKYRKWRMLVVLHFSPGQTYRFGAKGVLPDRDHRIARSENPLDEFVFLTESSTPMPDHDSVNVVIRGESFDHKLLYEMTAPTYLVNWPYKVEGDNFVYATSDRSHLRRFSDNDMLPILSLQEVAFDQQGNMHRHELPDDLQVLFDRPSGPLPANQRILFYHLSSTPDYRLGSALDCIIALAKVSKRMDIYGWDQLLTSPPDRQGYLGALFSLASADPGSYRPYIVETALINWLYAHRLADLPSIKNHGYLGSVHQQPKLMGKIVKVFYLP